MEHIDAYFSDKIVESDLNQHKAPFLNETFAKWRKHTFKKFPVPLDQFVNLVDNYYLFKFIPKISVYYQLTNLENITHYLQLREINMPEVRKSVNKLCEVIAKWSTEVELSVDIMQRCKLYGIYSVPEDLSDLYSQMKVNWKDFEEPSLHKLYRLLMRLASFGPIVIGDMIRALLSGVTSAKLYQHKNQLINAGMQLIGLVPVALASALGTQLVWFVVSWILIDTANQLSHEIDLEQITYHIEEIKKHFEYQLSELMFQNERSKSLIDSYVNSEEKDKFQRLLKEHLNSVLFHKVKSTESQTKFDTTKFIAENSSFEEDGDWVVISPPSVNTKQCDNSWVMIK